MTVVVHKGMLVGMNVPQKFKHYKPLPPFEVRVAKAEKQLAHRAKGN